MRPPEAVYFVPPSEWNIDTPLPFHSSILVVEIAPKCNSLYKKNQDEYSIWDNHRSLQGGYNPSFSHWSRRHPLIDLGRVLSDNVHTEDGVWITV